MHENPSPERRFNEALETHGKHLTLQGLLDGLRKYVVDRVKPDSLLLRGIIANKWDDTILGTHNAIHVSSLKEFTLFVLVAVPAEARGSYEAMEKWGAREGNPDA